MHLDAPQNPLEQALLALRQGELGLAAVLSTLLQQQVYILLPTAPTTAELEAAAIRPLLLQNGQQETLLAVFSAAERALPLSLQFPAYGHAQEVAMTGLLGLIRPGIGLVLNPGTALGFEMPAAALARLQASASASNGI